MRSRIGGRCGRTGRGALVIAVLSAVGAACHTNRSGRPSSAGQAPSDSAERPGEAAALPRGGETGPADADHAERPANLEQVDCGASKPPPHTSAFVREEHMVIVDGVAERWRLEWEYPPALTFTDENWSGFCRLNDFEFAEAGILDLVRERPGDAEDRLHLTPLLAAEPERCCCAELTRWPRRKDDRWRWDSVPPDLSEIKKRPKVFRHEVLRLRP